MRVPPRASGGHLLAGLIVMLCAYLVSALLVERLFKIVKPKLLTLSWFVIIWEKSRPRSGYSAPLAQVKMFT